MPPGMVAILREVYAREGWRGLFKGLSMNWIKVRAYAGVLGWLESRIEVPVSTMGSFEQPQRQIHHRAPWRWASASPRSTC